MINNLTMMTNSQADSAADSLPIAGNFIAARPLVGLQWIDIKSLSGFVAGRTARFSLLAGKTGAGWRSARQALGARRDVVKGKRHRYAGVKADQADHVGDALMAECGDRAVEEALGDPARIGKARRHLVDDLLALVVERGRQTGQQCLDLVRRQPRRLAGALVRIGRISRMPLAV